MSGVFIANNVDQEYYECFCSSIYKLNATVNWVINCHNINVFPRSMFSHLM